MPGRSKDRDKGPTTVTHLQAPNECKKTRVLALHVVPATGAELQVYAYNIMARNCVLHCSSITHPES